MHGGTSPGAPKGSRRALKHGIYSDVLLPEDVELMEGQEIGTLDHEIKVARIRLRRALREQVRQECEANGVDSFELNEVTITTADGKTESEVKRIRRDYSREIRAYVRLVADLEVKRLQLAAGGGGDPGEIAVRIRLALTQIDQANGTAPESVTKEDGDG